MEDVDTPDPFVIAARFEDPTEGWIAAGALRDQGLDVIYNASGAGYGGINMLVRRACGGAHMMVPTSQVREARAYLRSLQPVDDKASDWPRHPRALSSAPLAALCAVEPYGGYLVADARRRPTPARVIVAVVLSVFYLGPILLALLADFALTILNLLRLVLSH